ncbi:uncharacterized protein LOC116130588 isoform X3 [Pistacia vera]|uniref:uncharacterized protein LOC116130588 isoform X3 n=1 Tax=Pistacia vera TaxID=55513 RepID=UPI001262C9F0|nr:uncharacterized protein LOC116130588 isoform X3 [Pistacia vera]
MGEQSHISMDFDNIISVTLENYLDLQMKPGDGKEARQHSQSQDQWVQGVRKEESHGSSFPDMSTRVSSRQNLVTNPDLYSTTKSLVIRYRSCLFCYIVPAVAFGGIRRKLSPVAIYLDQALGS